MNYSEKPGMVRFDFFKSNGKWYMTEAVDMEGFYNETFVQDAVKKAFAKDCRDSGREPHNNFTIVVTEPYHHGAYPVMLVAGSYSFEE